MTWAVTEATVDGAELARILRPRTGLVAERDEGGGRFALDEGPLTRYSRVIETAPAEDGRVQVRQEVDYRLAAPFFAWFMWLPVRNELRRLVAAPAGPWWGPPQRIGLRAAGALDALAAAAFILGYLSTLLTQTFTYAAQEFGADHRAQGVALAAVRADVVISFALVAMADRRGRRSLLLLCCAAGAALTATGALAPSLPWLAASQVAARGFVTAGVVLVAIMVAEEAPAGSRAWATSMVVMAGGLGAGLCVVALPVAGLGLRAWRLLFAGSLLGLFLVRAVSRRLPETRRFRAPHAAATVAGHGRRLWLLAAAAFLLALFTIPSSEFLNEFLRKERGFSPAHISLFTVLTASPAAVGIVVGGRLADVRGRRVLGALGVAGGVGFTVLMFLSRGWPLWTWSVAASVAGGVTVPALGVYGPELFPTSLRGRANGVIYGVGRVGSVIGLVAAGYMSRAFGSLTPAFALLALGPALLVVLVLAAYPETARRELEDLNPEDRDWG